MTAPLALLAAVAMAGLGGDRAGLIGLGRGAAEGILLNVAPGSRPWDVPDPSRPTVVFIHGLNPVPWAVHFTMAERLAEAVARRYGPAFNVLAWDWNDAADDGLTKRARWDNAIGQGRALAAALRGAGVDPSRTHLIGHSSGGIVAASAARTLAAGPGRPAAQLTLLDPAACYHHVIFGELAAGSAAPRVENIWAAGPSGYGREVAAAGVRNTRLVGPNPLLGTVCPLRSAHLFSVRWYIGTVEDPTCPSGFNTSPLLRDPG